MTRAEAARHHVENPEAFEHGDLRPNGVFIFLACLMGSVLLTLVVVWGLFGLLTRLRGPEQPLAVRETEQALPEPRIQAQPLPELRALRAREDATLNSYGWVDPAAGIVRIPIGRAMDIVAERGLPYYSGTGSVPTVPDTGPQSGGPQTGSAAQRGQPAQPWAAKETSEPLRGLQPGLSGQPR